MDPGGAINVHRGLLILVPPLLIFRNIWTRGPKYMDRGYFLGGAKFVVTDPSVYQVVAYPLCTVLSMVVRFEGFARASCPFRGLCPS